MPIKKLGQHWLKDRVMLEAIADSADLNSQDTVLEIGPGLGTLTSVLLRKAGTVVAVEYDDDLACKLPGQFPGTSLRVVHANILQFDPSVLPRGYKLVANVPYYITTKIIEKFLRANEMPEVMVLLVQKEVAEKLAAEPGDYTATTVLLQMDYDVQLGTRVPKEYFLPPPTVDSQVIICKKHHVVKDVEVDQQLLYRVVHAGFSAPRKKLRSSLAGGLGVSTSEVERLLIATNISPNLRAQQLDIAQWVEVTRCYNKMHDV